MPPALDRIATIAHYGPDNTRASKTVVTIVDEDDEHIAARTWTSDENDLRHDAATKAEILAFVGMHGVRETVTADRIIGCPHQEGLDYPLGRTYPQCPFWANLDRFTHEPLKAPRATMTPEQVLAELSRERVTSPKAALESADAHRSALTQPLLALLERVVAAPDRASDEEALLFSYALYLLAKWRETRAYPLVVQWLALPDEGAYDLTGDVVTEGGNRILAAVCDGNLQPIIDLACSLDADDYARIAAIEALALLAVWGEVPRPSIVDVMRRLAREGLPRKADAGWQGLAWAAASMAATEIFDDIRRAMEAGWIDPQSTSPDELDEIEDAPDEAIEETREQRYPIDDVSAATSWWACFAEHQPGKVGRNDPCPCGSGKKYKKCCGQ